MNTTLISFKAFDDASGAPAIIEVTHKGQTARFALDILGEVTVNGLGSGMSSRMTHKAAAAAEHHYQSYIATVLGSEWIGRNVAMYMGD